MAGLALLAFLGFYVYGLVLGAFSPFELTGFTVIAVVAVIFAVVHVRRTRRAIKEIDDPSHSQITGEAQREHERRGF